MLNSLSNPTLKSAKLNNCMSPLYICLSTVWECNNIGVGDGRAEQDQHTEFAKHYSAQNFP